MKFTFDPATGRYTDEHGHVITEAELRKIQAKSEDKHTIELMALAIAFLLWRQRYERLAEDQVMTARQILELVPEADRLRVKARVRELGPIEGRQFQIRLADQIEKAHRVNAVLAAGGFTAMTIQMWNYAAQRAQSERGYAQRMAQQVVVGQVSAPQLVNRTSMYAEAPYTTFAGTTDKRERGAGVLEARRILDPQAEHCEDCPQFASAEYQRIEEVKPIGESVCGPRCRCWIQYRRTSSAQPAEAAAAAAAA